MLNYREVGSYALSGGWTNLEKDVKALKGNIQYIYDLQFTKDDQKSMPLAIKELCEAAGIEYKWIPFFDSEFNTNLRDILTKVADQIKEWEDKINAQKKEKSKRTIIVSGDPKSRILIKCGAGISRSPAALIFYLCTYKRLTFMEALAWIRAEEKYQTTLQTALNMTFYDSLKAWFPEVLR